MAELTLFVILAKAYAVQQLISDAQIGSIQLAQQQRMGALADQMLAAATFLVQVSR